MADPVLPGGIRVLFVLQGVSNLPEDRYITTWAFSSDAASSDEAKHAAIGAVQEFYFLAASPSTVRVAEYISGSAVNTALSHCRAYDLGQPVNERVPFIESMNGNNFGGGQALPSEVALCLSYHDGLNKPSHRGRVYLGPLVVAASTNDDGPTEVNPTFQVSVKNAALRLANRATSAPVGPQWCGVFSPGGLTQLRAVTGGWVDNAFDTQRRRGEAATNRQVFAVA